MMMTNPQTISIVEFSSGLPGFPEATRFELKPWGEASEENPFWLLSSLDYTELAFVVCPPWVFYPDYDFNLDDVTTKRLALRTPADVMVLAIVTVGEHAEDSTVNLLGPIVVNRHSGKAVQVVLSDFDFDVRAPLVRS